MTVIRESNTHAVASSSTRTTTVRRTGLRAGAALVTALAIFGSLGYTQAAQAAEMPPSTIYVSPAGSDLNTGLSTDSPYRTIQRALNKATAGVTITLGPGNYRESVHTVVAGTAEAPITIKGSGAGTTFAGTPAATVYGTGHVFDIDHSNYRLDGFAVNGEEGLVGKTFPTTLSQTVAFKDANQSVIVDSRPIYVSSNNPLETLTNVSIANMTVSGSGGECIRLRNTSYSMITNSTVSWCGMSAKQTDGTFLYHNGEGIYIGSSPKAGAAADDSSFNVMTGNRINTFGSECLDVKENSHDNLFSNNDCGYNNEPREYYGSNLELRGYNNIVADNRISQSVSFGVKLKSDNATLDRGNNSVTNNVFTGQQSFAIRKEQATIGALCGNLFAAGATWYGTTSAAATAPCPA